MLKLLFSVVFAVMVSLTAFATPPTVVLVQHWTYQQEVTVTRGAGRTEVLKPVSALDKNKNANVEQLHGLFTRLYGEGYTLQNSTVAGSTSNNSQTVTYVFVKP